MKLVKQTEPDNCGPCVVAMLANRFLAELPEIVEDGRSPTYRMRDALAQFVLSFSLVGEFKDLPLPLNQGAFLITIKTDKGRTFKHWIAFDGEEIYDPKFGIRKKLQRTSRETVESALFFLCQNNG